MARWMGIEHRAPAVELFKDGREDWIAEEFVVVVGLQMDAVCLERAERVFNLPPRAVDVRKGHVGEAAEPAWMIGAQLGDEFVGEPRKSSRLGVVARFESQPRDRGDRERDAA